MGSVVVVNLALQEVVGVIVVLDFLKGQEVHQAPLEGAEESLDFALGLRRGGHTVIDAQGREGPLKLGVCVQAVLGRSVAKEAQTVGIETGWAAVLFKSRAQQAEMARGGVLIKAARHDFAGGIIGR